jgi:hypothetical protein
MFYTYNEFVSKDNYILPDSVQEIINKINQKFSPSTTVSKPVQKNVMWTGGKIKSSPIVQLPQPLPKVVLDMIEEDKMKINTQMIRISLNKLSLKNYVIQKDIIINSLTFFVNNENDNVKNNENDNVKGASDLENIIDLMFTIITGNVFFNEVYCKLYDDLQKTFPFLEKKLSLSFQDFFSNITTAIMDTSAMTFDELCVYNTLKSERKSLALFYAQMKNLGKLTMNDILMLLEKIQQFILSIDNMDIKDELVDIICIIYSKCNQTSKFSTVWILYVNQLREFIKCSNISKKSVIMILNAIE